LIVLCNWKGSWVDPVYSWICWFSWWFVDGSLQLKRELVWISFSTSGNSRCSKILGHLFLLHTIQFAHTHKWENSFRKLIESDKERCNEVFGCVLCTTFIHRPVLFALLKISKVHVLLSHIPTIVCYATLLPSKLRESLCNFHLPIAAATFSWNGILEGMIGSTVGRWWQLKEQYSPDDQTPPELY
jgi:hypothetical protein